MPEITRINDDTVGTCNPGLPCCPHSRRGINQDASPDVRINGLFVHRLGDTGSCRCPHGGVFESTEGSSSVRVNGIPVTRVRDATVCKKCGVCGTHATGSPDVRAG